MVETNKSRSDTGARLIEIYRLLRQRFGHRHWWPADSPFEVAVGAVLTQNTAWKNTALAIQNLKDRNLLSPDRLHRTPTEELAGLIRSAGYFNQKARALKDFLAYLQDHHGGRLESLDLIETGTLRRELLEIKRIGPETADSILLYALGRPVFVVDAYTKRVFSRHGFFAAESSYQDVQRFFRSNLPEDVELFNDFHAQIVALGHTCCRPRPLCDGCPLEELPRYL